MGEAVGAVERMVGFVAQLESLPLAERGRVATEIDQDVEDRPRGRSGSASPSHAGSACPDDPLPRARVVVLDEVLSDPELAELVLPIGLEEEAASIAVDDRLDQDRAVQPCGQRAHGAAI